MTVETGLRAFLLGNADIAALVTPTSPAGPAQIYPGALPQKYVSFQTGLCAIVMVFVSNPGGMHLRGPNGTTRDRWQLDSWALTSDGAMRLGRLVRWRLNGYQGTWTDTESPANTISVQCIYKDNEQRIPEVEIHGGLYRHSGDYFATYSASEDRVLI